MKKVIITLVAGIVLSVSTIVLANEFMGGRISIDNGKEIIQIVLGKKSNTIDEVNERLWRLEAAVIGLQEEVYHLARDNSRRPAKELWTCRVEAMGKKYYGQGPTQGTAEMEAMEECQKDSRLCRVDECTNS